MDKMLRRLIGENIDLLSIPFPGLGRVRADRGQIEQVIMNLAVNARDAMASGGKLTIETREVDVDSEYAARHPGLQAGSCVMLAVTDNGEGMNEEVKARLFEPFFTTKERGKGTGLGLATVHGIVKQSGGDIQVYSQIGHGTTFKIYLPRIDELMAAQDATVPPSLPRGKETVLLVEDEAAVGKLARQALEASGYRVLMAHTGEEALQLAQGYRGDIDLLLTDMIMPGITGTELSEQLTKERTHVRVLYMSGYTDNAFFHQGRLTNGTAFLQKPFSLDDLLQKVREVLEAPAVAA
jgi:CheY-like chemotaxis protein